ncbi:hypothetical protein [Telmatospirillum sp.]|uniref:hypothetical protein n=1 Tax=Telmatospirillum sp. TaxID=2079197 RepID=UPI00283C4B65|nr:hypothetical protein [Telmatospirillum sp.]MDR3440749.1 hypothetical protein [Telmatospirillum sp.]
MGSKRHPAAFAENSSEDVPFSTIWFCLAAAFAQFDMSFEDMSNWASMWPFASGFNRLKCRPGWTAGCLLVKSGS